MWVLGTWQSVADAQIIDYGEKIKNSWSVLRGHEKKDFLGTRRLAVVQEIAELAGFEDSSSRGRVAYV